MAPIPFRYDAPGQLKAAIVARVAAGETVVAIGREPGMPGEGCVQVWRRADAAFAAELAAARARGVWIRERRFDAAVAGAFLKRLAEGETVRALLGQPGMPSQRAYRYWRMTDMGFQEALWLIRGPREARRLEGLKARYRAWDEGVADRVLLAVMRGARLRALLASDPAFPSLAVLARWRCEEPVWDVALRKAMGAGRRARGRGPPPELIEEIGARIAEGASLRSLGRARDMPSAGAMYGWMKRWPAFAAEVNGACDFRDAMLRDRVLAACEAAPGVGVAAVQLQAAALRWRVGQLAKRPGWKALR